MLSYYQNGNKVLAFGYGYAHLIRERQKTKTVRLVKPRSYTYSPGEQAVAHAKWGVESVDVPITIKAVTLKRFADLTAKDLKGESPDSRTPEALRCVMGNLYKEEFSLDSLVQIIDFDYV